MARICVVEDDEDTRSAVTRFLEFSRYEVVAYDDALPALSAEGRFDRVDLILTDSSMPTPAGAILAALIDMQVKVPVIVMSGNFRDSDRDLYDRMGAALLMDKPIGLDDLVHAVKTVLAEAAESSGTSGEVRSL
jgi:two-component system capsular synthesis sensor histidine kinase RcsC